MGYRFNDKPPKPEEHLRTFDVRNGAQMRATFGCYYAHEGHDPKVHDYYGWPDPRHPDDICQMLPDFVHPYHNKDKRPLSFQPIHLLEEGYTSAIVVFEDRDFVRHLNAKAWIDEDDDCLVRMTVYAGLPTFSDKPKDVNFTLFVRKADREVSDAVCHGTLTVLPGNPYIVYERGRHYND